MTVGVAGVNPILYAWLANNSEPHYRRATSVALAVLGGNVVCFADKYTIIFLTHFPFFRVAFWVPGVSQPRTDQNSAKQRSCVSCCTWTTTFLCLNFYRPSLSSCITVFVGSLINMVYLSWRNKVKKRPGVRTKLLEKYAAADDSDGGLRAWIDLGDRHPDFVYTLWI